MNRRMKPARFKHFLPWILFISGWRYGEKLVGDILLDVHMHVYMYGFVTCIYKVKSSMPWPVIAFVRAKALDMGS